MKHEPLHNNLNQFVFDICMQLEFLFGCSYWVFFPFFVQSGFFFKKSDVNARKYFATKQLKWK